MSASDRLTDDERGWLADAFVDANRREFMDLTVDGEDEAADPDTPILRAVERIVAAREEAREADVRAQTKADIEVGGRHEPAMDGDEWYVAGWREATEHAARIAGGDQ